MITKETTTRDLFIEYGQNLPEAIKKACNDGTAFLADSNIFTCRSLSTATTIELFQASDKIKDGICNFNDRKLDTGNYMLLLGMRLQTAVVAEVTDENIAKADYTAKLDSAVANGDLELRVASKVVIPRTSCQVFTGTTRASLLKGYYALECPYMIAPDAQIVPTLRLGTPATDKTVVRFELHGARLI